jgi:L-lactate utilization protein LutC
VKRFDVPEKLVLKEEGNVIFDQSLPKVRSLSTYPDTEVCLLSKRFIDQHLNDVQATGRVIMQVNIAFIRVISLFVT